VSTKEARAFSCSAAVWNVASIRNISETHHYLLTFLACDILRRSHALVINIPATLTV